MTAPSTGPTTNRLHQTHRDVVSSMMHQGAQKTVRCTFDKAIVKQSNNMAGFLVHMAGTSRSMYKTIFKMVWVTLNPHEMLSEITCLFLRMLSVSFCYSASYNKWYKYWTSLTLLLQLDVMVSCSLVVLQSTFNTKRTTNHMRHRNQERADMCWEELLGFQRTIVGSVEDSWRDEDIQKKI